MTHRRGIALIRLYHQCAPAVLFDLPARCLGAFGIMQKGNGDIGSFLGKGDCRCLAYAGIRACYHRDPIPETHLFHTKISVLLLAR
jgi:hypothetical protein